MKTVRSYEMLKPGQAVMVAVSGGPDSVFLLHALLALRRKLALKEVVVCNLDHGLRGEASKADSSFVAETAKALGVEYVHKKIDLSKEKSKKLSTEEVAREARYAFFQEAAAQTGARVIATGHTLDDQAETVLMRFIKGASLKGIVGISPVRNEGAVTYIRPLLQIEKSEIEAFLKHEDIAYKVDRTNLEGIYFRNVVRSEIIPFLEKYNPRLKRSLFNLAEHVREDYEFIEESKKAHRVACDTDGDVALALKDIIVQPRAMQKEILRDALETAGGEVKRLSFRHWKEVEQLIRTKRTGNAVDLPGGMRILRTPTQLLFVRLK